MPASIALTVVIFGVVGWIILRGVRRLESAVEAARRRAFEGLKVHTGPATGLVFVVFHTYHGFIVFAMMTEYRFWAPPADAREALRRLHRFNMTWGMLSKALLFMPFLSSSNYFLQKRSIRRQEAAMLE